MPIYDMRCPSCKDLRKDVFTKTWDAVVMCACGGTMGKVPSRFTADVFPNGGIFQRRR
jgi:predicted nucleic acid-binding Zn ribbon protein